MKIIEIQANDHFIDVMPLIPTDSIINKRVPGLGATYAEIKAPRHSIIIEPNVPVIKIKCDKPVHANDNLFGVYENVMPSNLREYLEESMRLNKQIKIMTTPESYWKIKKAASELNFDIYQKCFMLFDECHKIVKDVDFREDIALPFEDFFQFRQKALLSATPIRMTDPRFNEFKRIDFDPQYSIIKPVTLFPTNNTMESLKRVLFGLGDDNLPRCIFVNSTDLCYALMEQLDIKEEAAVFCAPKSVDRLQHKQFNEAYADFNPDKMKKYNFFTSRFYCAVDIELAVKTNLIVITDIQRVAHTAIHPETDFWQIVGRFRNGTANIYHIMNFNDSLPVFTSEDLKAQINMMEGEYTGSKLRYKSATDLNGRVVFAEILKKHPYKKFLVSPSDAPYEEVKSWFKVDNYIGDGLTVSLYHDFQTLKAAYQKTGLFFITEITNGFYRDNEKFQKVVIPRKLKTIREKQAAIVKQMDDMKDWAETQFKREWRNKLHKTDAFIVEAYEQLGKATIEILKYSQQKIRQAMILKRYEAEKYGTALIDLLKNTFTIGRKYRVNEIKSTIMNIYRSLQLTPLESITAYTLKDYFDVQPTWTGKRGKRERALYLTRAKY